MHGGIGYLEQYFFNSLGAQSRGAPNYSSTTHLHELIHLVVDCTKMCSGGTVSRNTI